MAAAKAGRHKWLRFAAGDKAYKVGEHMCLATEAAAPVRWQNPTGGGGGGATQQPPPPPTHKQTRRPASQTRTSKSPQTASEPAIGPASAEPATGSAPATPATEYADDRACDGKALWESSSSFEL